MQERFGLVTGLSDHTVDNTTVITSVALGSSIIEEHVTLDRNGGGPDDSFSLESKELKQLCLQVKIACKTFEKVDCSIKSREQTKVRFLHSLCFVKGVIGAVKNKNLSTSKAHISHAHYTSSKVHTYWKNIFIK